LFAQLEDEARIAELLTSDGQLFPYPIVEELPTIRQEPENPGEPSTS
jgi:hypothetical protein